MSTVNANTLQSEENIFRGAHRSRFSFHFNFLRRRQWLLVQLVSVPVDGEHIEADTDLQLAADAQREKPCPIGRLIDQYQQSQMTRRII